MASSSHVLLATFSNEVWMLGREAFGAIITLDRPIKAWVDPRFAGLFHFPKRGLAGMWHLVDACLLLLLIVVVSHFAQRVSQAESNSHLDRANILNICDVEIDRRSIRTFFSCHWLTAL